MSKPVTTTPVPPHLSDEERALRQLVADVRANEGLAYCTLYLASAIESLLTALSTEREALDWATGSFMQHEVVRRFALIASFWREAHPDGGIMTSESRLAAITKAREYDASLAAPSTETPHAEN